MGPRKERRRTQRRKARQAAAYARFLVSPLRQEAFAHFRAPPFDALRAVIKQRIMERFGSARRAQNFVGRRT